MFVLSRRCWKVIKFESLIINGKIGKVLGRVGQEFYQRMTLLRDKKARGRTQRLRNRARSECASVTLFICSGSWLEYILPALTRPSALCASLLALTWEKQRREPEAQTWRIFYDWKWRCENLLFRTAKWKLNPFLVFQFQKNSKNKLKKK